jgi:hypothetical protein
MIAVDPSIAGRSTIRVTEISIISLSIHLSEGYISLFWLADPNHSKTKKRWITGNVITGLHIFFIG